MKETILKLLKGSEEDIRIAHNLIYAYPNFQLLFMRRYEGGKTRQFIYYTQLNNIIRKEPGWRKYFDSYVLTSTSEYHRDPVYTEFENALILSYRGNLYTVKTN